jgi:hypothetical protein
MLALVAAVEMAGLVKAGKVIGDNQLAVLESVSVEWLMGSADDSRSDVCQALCGSTRGGRFADAWKA